jgi:nitrogen fixation protein FixH
LHHHEEAKKEAAAAKRVTPGITIASATAQKGDIGVYLDAVRWMAWSLPCTIRRVSG